MKTMTATRAPLQGSAQRRSCLRDAFWERRRRRRKRKRRRRKRRCEIDIELNYSFLYTVDSFMSFRKYAFISLKEKKKKDDSDDEKEKKVLKEPNFC